MLDFPAWKHALIWLTVLAGLLLASPNIFYQRVEAHNDALAEVGDDSFPTDDQQSAIDGWPGFLPSGLVNLGLDLRGGAHLLAEVRVEDVYATRMDAYWPPVRDAIREATGTTVERDINAPADVLHVRIGDTALLPDAVQAVRDTAQSVPTLTGLNATDIQVRPIGPDVMEVSRTDDERRAMADRAVGQSLEIIRRRVDETGTREPTIQRQGAERILIQVPGLGSAEELKELLGTTASLSFHPVVGRVSSPDAPRGALELVYPSIDEPGVWYIVERAAVVTGDDLVDANPAFDQNGNPSVEFRFGPSGGARFGQYTAQNVGSLFAIVLDEEVISAPRINEPIPGGSGQITGNFTVESSTNLAILLRAGALPAELTFEQESTIGPELGQDSINAGRIACLVALAAVLVFMALSYGWFGLIADVALLINIGLIFGLLSLIGGTLTLPGIAGIVLTIGMAVDANVLIFERIREELRTAKGPARAIDLGYQRAFSAIVDANITTMIAAVILFAMGSGPVRGFAITLGLGILTSLFTAIFVTRSMIVAWLARTRPKTLEV